MTVAHRQGSPDWFDLSNSSLTAGLCIFINPGGEALTRSRWLTSDQNNVGRSVSNYSKAPVRHVNYGYKHAMSARLPSVTGTSTGGPPRLHTTLDLQKQWRKVTGDLTYLYIGYGANIGNGQAFWALPNQWSSGGVTNWCCQDYLPYSSFTGIREFAYGGAGSYDNSGSFNGLRVRFTNPTIGAPIILTRSGSNASVYVGQAVTPTYTQASGVTLSGEINWSQTYNANTIPPLESVYTNNAFVAGLFGTYDPYDASSFNYATAGVGVVAIWNRVLTASERIAVFNDPMLMLKSTAKAPWRKGLSFAAPPASTWTPRTVWV